MAYIYQIINIINNKRYIGETLNLKDRFNAHISSLQNNKHHSNKLQNAFNKYGIDAFKFEQLAEVPDEDRFDWECYYINKYDSYNNGYNETTGGDNPGFEKLQKQVYCYSFEGDYLDEWYISGREASRILDIDQGLLQKICTGQKKSAYDKNNRRLRFSYVLVNKLPIIDTHSNQSQKIYQCDKNNNILRIFNNYGDAVESLGLSRNSRHGLINAIKTYKEYHGYFWKI